MITQFQIGRDSLGEVQVLYDALHEIQTVRAIRSFPITHLRTRPAMIRSLGMTRKACAMANHECGHLGDERAEYIIAAYDEIIQEKLDCQFITDVIQGDAVTSANVNTSEVVANRAAQLTRKMLGVYDHMHPSDHVNSGQSTNDVSPTVGKLTTLLLIEDLLKGLILLQEALLDRSVEFNDAIRLGHAHLQDAVPIRIGQEFHAFAMVIVRDIRRIKMVSSNLGLVNMGVTAVGAGISMDGRYRRICVKHLCGTIRAELTGVCDLIDGIRNAGPFVFTYTSLKTFCVPLSKMCSDFRLMASGSKAGLAEIVLPAGQPGSNIISSKVNPVIPKVRNQVCFQIFGNDVTITKAAETGQTEPNVFESALFFNPFQSMDLLHSACHTLRIHTVMGVQASTGHYKEVMESSLGTTTALAPHIGYVRVNRMAKLVLEEGRKLKELTLENGLMGKDRLEEVPNIRKMARTGIPGMHKKSRKQTGR